MRMPRLIRGSEIRAHEQLGRTQSAIGLSQAHQLQKPLDVVSQGVEPMGDGPKPTETQGVQRQAAKCRHHAYAVTLAEALSILVELGVRVSSIRLPSRMPLLPTERIMALPGQFSTTHFGAGMARSVQVMSRPCPRSRLLVW